ncbi:uncharacterized protein BKA55DRAFT_513935, partial [Fusarium redolens]
NKRPAESSPGNKSISAHQTMANSSAARVTPAKRQKTTNSQSRTSQISESTDWNTLLPSGNEFKKILKAALVALARQIKRFEQLLTSINDKHRSLAADKRSCYSKKEELAKSLEKAQESLKDVEKSIATNNNVLIALENVYNHPGDKEFHTFLDKRRKTISEHQEMYTIVTSQLDRSSAELPETEGEIELVTMSSVANNINNMILPIWTPSQYYCIVKGCILYYPI